jgi:hypothetical protein
MSKKHSEPDDGVTDMTMGVYRRVYAGFIRGRRINQLSLEAEAWFWRVNSAADDFGNAEGDPILCHAATKGRRNGVTTEQVTSWLQEMAFAGLIRFYDAEGDTYLHIMDFARRQPAGRNGKRVKRFPRSPWDDNDRFQDIKGESGGIQVNPDLSRCSDTHTHTHTQAQSSGGAADAALPVPADANRQPNRKPTKAKGKTRKPADERPTGTHSQAVAYFLNRWAERYPGKNYGFDNVGGAHVSWLLVKVGNDLEQFRAMTDAYLANETEFFAGHDLGLLKSQYRRFMVSKPSGGASSGSFDPGAPGRAPTEEELALISAPLSDDEAADYPGLVSRAKGGSSDA